MSRILPIPMGVGGSNYYTKAEIDAMLANYAQLVTTDLVNYYLKSETYTKAEIEALVGQITSFEVVATLPVSDIKTNVIYLLGPTGSGADKYEEYIYSNNAWVKIGETSIDLSNYVTVTQLNTALGFYTTTQQLNTLLQGKQDVLTAGTGITISSNVISADIPAVGTGVVTLTQGGATIGTFGLNDSDDKTIDIPAGGGGGNAWYGSQYQFDTLGTYDADTDYYISEISYSEIKGRPDLTVYETKTASQAADQALDTKIAGKENSIVFLGTAGLPSIGTPLEGVTYAIEGETLPLTFTLADQSTVTYNFVID